MRTRDLQKVKLVKQQAIENIVQYGLEGFSMNKLAKACHLSVATLYIYYKDRDDLIISIAEDEGEKMNDYFIRNFDPTVSFEEGMRIQWQNRYDYIKDRPLSAAFFEQIRSSSYQARCTPAILSKFKTKIGAFMCNAIERGEIKALPFEVFWTVAYAPFYSLVRFDREGQSVGGKPFKLTNEILWQTFDLVMKALKN